MNFFKKYILVRYTILMVAFLLPLVLILTYSYYNYRYTSITNDVVFEISSIKQNTKTRYSELGVDNLTNNLKIDSNISANLRKELEYLSKIPFIVCAEFENTNLKKIIGAWPLPKCIIIKKPSTKVETEINDSIIFKLYYDHLYVKKILNNEMQIAILVIIFSFIFLLLILILSNYLIISRPVKQIITAINSYKENSINFKIKSTDFFGKTFNNEDEFGRIAKTMSDQVNSSELYLKKINEQREQMIKDMDDARKLQNHILPKVEDLSFPLGVMNKAAKGLSGDFYDFVKLDEDNYFFILADVSGKGVQASVVMIYALSIFRQEVITSKNLKNIITKINNGISFNFEGLFITCVIGFFNISKKEIEFYNLGHNPPIYIGINQEVKQFEAATIPLGIMPDINTDIKKEIVDLSKGRIFFYTDGFPETKINNQEIGEDGLITEIKKCISSSAQETTNKIMSQKIFNPEELADDMTFMTIGPLNNI